MRLQSRERVYIFLSFINYTFFKNTKSIAQNQVMLELNLIGRIWNYRYKVIVSSSNIDISKKFQGQWGGKIDNGEEMWWSDYSIALAKKNKFSRFWFRHDNRHYFLLRFFEHCLQQLTRDNVKIIDYGCGTGGTTLNFSNYLGIAFHGFDVFPTQLEIAQSFASKTNNLSQFTLVDKDSGRTPLLDESVDIIYSADVLAHVPDVSLVLKEWYRILKPNGNVVLYTEAACSPNDSSVMGKLAKSGIDMIGSVPEHISLFPREQLEEMFSESGFAVQDRISGNVFHFLFNPKEFYTALQDAQKYQGLKYLAYVLDRVNKIIPFFPKPQHLLRIFLTRILGRRAYGCNYFYLLRKPV